MELIRSRLLTAPHGFPTRAGGVSTGPFASLNASRTVGDLPGAVEENLARLAGAAGGSVLTVEQVHGAEVLHAEAGERERPADGLWTDTPGRVVGVRTADCVPILIEDPAARRVAAVHAGWRGVDARIVEVAVAALAARGSRPQALRVALGPCIQRCCYQVGPDLAARFAQGFGAEVVGEGTRLDLQLALLRSLERAGVPLDQVDRLPHCTACDERFFSHRRDRGHTGRHLNFIACAFGGLGHGQVPV